MRELNPFYAGLGIYQAFRYTKLFDQGVKMGLLYPEVEIDHFYKRRPKDYYFINPKKRVLAISPERFQELVDFMTKAFDRHNKSLDKMAKRGWARKKVYLSDVRLLYSDVKKAISWILNR